MLRIATTLEKVFITQYFRCLTESFKATRSSTHSLLKLSCNRLVWKFTCSMKSASPRRWLVIWGKFFVGSASNVRTWGPSQFWIILWQVSLFYLVYSNSSFRTLILHYRRLQDCPTQEQHYIFSTSYAVIIVSYIYLKEGNEDILSAVGYLRMYMPS